MYLSRQNLKVQSIHFSIQQLNSYNYIRISIHIIEEKLPYLLIYNTF